MQILFHPLFHLSLGATSLICSGLLVKEIFSMRRQLHKETGRSRSAKPNKVKMKQVLHKFID